MSSLSERKDSITRRVSRALALGSLLLITSLNGVNGDIKDTKGIPIPKPAITNFSLSGKTEVKIELKKEDRKKLEDIVLGSIKLALKAESELPVTLNSYADDNEDNLLNDGEGAFRYEDRGAFYRNELVFVHGQKDKFFGRIVNVSLIDEQAGVGKDVKPAIVINNRQNFTGNPPPLYRNSRFVNLSFINFPVYHKILKDNGLIPNGQTNRLYTISVQVFDPKTGKVQSIHSTALSVNLKEKSPVAREK